MRAVKLKILLQAFTEENVKAAQQSIAAAIETINREGHALVSIEGVQDLNADTMPRRASRLIDERPDLSQREEDLLRALTQGLGNKEIAFALDITEATVKVHMKSLLRKLRAANRTQAALWAVANGYSAMAAAPAEGQPS